MCLCTGRYEVLNLGNDSTQLPVIYCCRCQVGMDTVQHILCSLGNSVPLGKGSQWVLLCSPHSNIQQDTGQSSIDLGMSISQLII